MGYDEHFSDTDATGKTLRVYPSKTRHVAENQYFAQFKLTTTGQLQRAAVTFAPAGGPTVAGPSEP